jgi:ABC-type branched-subunit amino acid transport system substrate-binding protein
MFWSCQDDNLGALHLNSNPVEKTVAVVLPMEDGLDKEWRQVFTMLEHNIDRAFSAREDGVKLNLEFYDESTENIGVLAGSLAEREDIYAVIGGLYSANAAILAAALCPQEKTYFTLATTEELMRGFSSTGHLWAMTETDITQMEVLLSKVVNYGGRSVALIADGSDPYGKTFVDWFGFQASELGLKVQGMYLYSGSDIADAACAASMSGADYVICAPSRVADIAEIVKKFRDSDSPALLFSDIAYGNDVIEEIGQYAEGIEGVCFGADPESGFDVSYRTFFGADPPAGAAQVYDAGMLIMYAAWYQELHPDVSTRDALRNIVDGRDFNLGSWMGEDMKLVVESMADGNIPLVHGASGSLAFDSKVYTNVLCTVYCNYKVYDGHYIILDYNTADGGNRKEATLAGWNWKATHMQEFGDNFANYEYAPLTSRQALLVASSSGWGNYRHQADVAAMYQLLKQHGYADDNIILIMADDIAYDEHNPEKGVVRITPDGDNMYSDLKIDYNLKDLKRADICNILAGTVTGRTPLVLGGDDGTDIFVFWSGHGTPGALCWDGLSMGVTELDMKKALENLAAAKRYRKLAFFVEACYSGSVFDGCIGLPGMLFVTAANADETSKADVYNADLGIWMSNRFTSTLIDNIASRSVYSIRDLYQRLFLNTVGSHVMIYNAEHYDNLYLASIHEYFDSIY